MPAPELSPFIVGIFGVTAGVLMVAAFHCIKVCQENDSGRRRTTASPPFPASRGQNIRSNNQEDASSSNRSFSTVQLLIASDYSKECKGETCSVCLSEFNEGDEVRVLPGCAHVFHVSCIDRWLLSHSNCPLCRADTLCTSRDNAAAAPNSGDVGGGTPLDVQGP